MKVKSESEVTQSCPTLCDPMDCCPPDSSVHGILQARVLEWGAIAFSLVTTTLFFVSVSLFLFVIFTHLDFLDRGDIMQYLSLSDLFY